MYKCNVASVTEMEFLLQLQPTIDRVTYSGQNVFSETMWDL